MLTPTFARILSFLAAAAVLPLLGIYAVLIRTAIPSADGGMEPTVAFICYVAFTLLFGSFIVIALNFSRQLARESKGIRQTP